MGAFLSKSIQKNHSHDFHRTTARIESGELRVDGDNLPTFLYNFDHRYNQENMLDGLLQSQILAQVFVSYLS